jgi:hypothetical protein
LMMIDIQAQEASGASQVKDRESQSRCCQRCGT